LLPNTVVTQSLTNADLTLTSENDLCPILVLVVCTALQRQHLLLQVTARAAAAQLPKEALSAYPAKLWLQGLLFVCGYGLLLHAWQLHACMVAAAAAEAA
jgi:hypothetical protein